MRILPLILMFLVLIVSFVPTSSHNRVFTASQNVSTIQSKQVTPNTSTAAALNLIKRQQYGEAITRLEQIIESNPNNGEALTYLATANLYLDLNFTKAKKEFDAAHKAGGGATFIVSHSHEKSISGDDIVDYCRGWLHLRKDGVEFAPFEGTHGFKLAYSDIVQFKQTRFSKTVFHIKVGEKNQNFRGRTGTELETLLVLAVYKSFIRN